MLIPKKIVLSGPTAIGKTSLSLKLAQEIGAEIVSADSMQVYQYMDIGVAKPSVHERSLIKHHLIDCVHPKEKFDVFKYQKYALKAFDSIQSKGKKILIVGGTGLYIKSLTHGIHCEGKNDHTARKQIEEEIRQNGLDSILLELKQCDRVKYEELKNKDQRRIIRALAYYRVNQKPLSLTQKDWILKEKQVGDHFILLGLTLDRSELYKRIDERVDFMFEKGLVDEVKNLVEMNLPDDSTCWQAIGYKELYSYVQGELSLSESKELIKRNSRRYAKRQLTWFRKQNNIKCFDVSQPMCKVIKGMIDEIMSAA